MAELESKIGRQFRKTRDHGAFRKVVLDKVSRSRVKIRDLDNNCEQKISIERFQKHYRETA